MSAAAGAADGTPLRGLRVLVTRSREQASRLSELLSERGAEPVEVPTLSIRDIEGPEVDAAARQLADVDDLVFTSPNGVRAFAAALRRAGRDPSTATGPRICVVGPSTAQAARHEGFAVSVVPDEAFVAEGLLAAMGAVPLAGRRVLIARASEARDVLEDGLRAAGAVVTVVAVYESVPATGNVPELDEALRTGLDLVTVASSKTAVFLDRMVDAAVRARLATVPFASIGPITSDAVRELGYSVAVEADPSTIEGLVDAIEKWARQRAAQFPA